MKDALFFLCFFLSSDLLAYDVFNFNTTRSSRLLTGTGTDVICPAVPTTLAPNGLPIPFAIYHAVEAIVSEGRVDAGGLVTFKAGNMITLTPGFHVVKEGNFLAIIEDCPEAITDFPEETAESRNGLSTTPFASKQALSVYPNPFSYTTTIDFDLFEEQKAHLAIYSATQQLVKVLETNKAMSKGNHKYEFSGDNLIGGMYFVVLTTENTRLTKKLILVK